MLNDDIYCYLSELAREAIDVMVDAGMDRDLALEVVGKLLPDEQMYELPDE